MPRINKLDKGLKNVDKIAKHAPAIGVVAGLISTAVSVVIELKENQKEKIDISPICPKSGHRITVDEAKDFLQDLEVKVSFVSIKPAEAKPEYRDYDEFQVVDISDTKIEPNKKLTVYYITRKVIDKSQQLFEESERQRMLAKEEKQLKRSEQKEKAKQAVVKKLDTAKRGIQKVPAVLHKKSKTEPEQEEQNETLMEK